MYLKFLMGPGVKPVIPGQWLYPAKLFVAFVNSKSKLPSNVAMTRSTDTPACIDE